MEEFFVVVSVLVAVLVFGLGLSYVGYQQHAFFAPRYAEIDKQVFEHGRAYNEGMVRDLENLKLQFESAKIDEQEALRATILHRFSVYQGSLPPDLYNFYNQLRSYR